MSSLGARAKAREARGGPRRLLLASVCTLFVMSACAESAPHAADEASGRELSDAAPDIAPDTRAVDASGDDASARQDGDTDADAKDAATPEVGGGSLCDETRGCAMTVNGTPLSVTEGVFEQGSATLPRPKQPAPGVDYDACSTNDPFPLPTYYAYVEIRNPTAQPLKVELRLDASPDGDPWVYTYAATYAALPSTSVERDACLTGLNDECPNPAGLVDPRWPCLVGDGAPTIPANGSIWLYVPSHSPPSQPTGATRARFLLRALSVGPT